MIPGALNYGTIQSAQPFRPLWAVDFEDDDTFLEWAEEFFAASLERHRQKAEKDLRCRDFYMGIQSIALGQQSIPRERDGKPVEKFARVIAPQAYEIVEQWVSKMTRYPPAIAVLPANGEYNDRIAAKMSKEFIDYLFYVNDIEELLETNARLCRIESESFTFVEWDKDKGDFAPEAKELLKAGVRIPLLDSTGAEVLNDDGDPLMIQEAPRVGDIKYEIHPRRFVIQEPGVEWKDANLIIKVSSQNIDELKVDYPDKAEALDDHANRTFSIFELFEPSEEENELLVFELYHKSTKYLAQGRYVKFVDGAVLESKPLPYSHGLIPAVRLSNIDVPGIPEAFSVVEQIMLLNVIYNNLISLGYTNIALGAHLYWLIPTAANIDISKIKNGNSIIRFAGGTPPSLQQYRTVGEEIFKMIELIDKVIQRPAGIQSVSRGEPPAGIEAGVALAFLEEQENQRANTDIKKHNAFIKKLARLSLSVAGDFYKPEDERTMRIVGKNNSFSVKSLDVAKLGGSYDIRVQRTTALSESKSGRLSQLLALQSRFPGLVPSEQVADMMDLANDKKFYSVATVAVEAAERENELMREGGQVSPPDEWEEHLVHWFSHVKEMQSASFKEDTPPEIKKAFIGHLQVHEYWMWTKAAINPAFKQRLLMTAGFPAVSEPPPVVQPTPAGMPAPGAPGSDPGAAPGADPQAGGDAQPDELVPEGTPPGENEADAPPVGATPPLPPEYKMESVPTN